MSFKGKVAFVAGGLGNVGSGIVRSLLRKGAKVAVSSRTQENLDKLKNSTSDDVRNNLILIKDNVGTEDGAERILSILKNQYGGVHHVVSSLGTLFTGGPLTKQSLEDFSYHVQDKAGTHFICFKTFSPFLDKEKGTTYTFITGAVAVNCPDPIFSLSAVGLACAHGVAAAGISEFKDSNVAVNELRMGFIVERELDKDIDDSKRILHFGGGLKLQVVGHDVIGDLVTEMMKSNFRGRCIVHSKEDIEVKRAECQEILNSKQT